MEILAGYSPIKEVAQMEIVRSELSRKLIEDALNDVSDSNLQNASFMLSGRQIEVIKQLARENRYLNSQGAVLRYILDDWMRLQLEDGSK